MKPQTLFITLCFLSISSGTASQIEIEMIPGQAEEGYIEIHGVSAGEFSPDDWEAGHLHFVPDYRSPMIRPLWDGVYRNIYAPSVVPTDDGWRIFYGAWDGSDRPNDRLYGIQTEDFLTFKNRRLVIENGPFIHVCNSHAIPNGSQGLLLAGTAYPDEAGLNKPILFESQDGESWNTPSTGVYTATHEDLIPIHGYSGFAEADNNGANVFLKDQGNYHFYFFNFKDPGKTFHAVGDSPRNLHFQGIVLQPSSIVNDIKKFSTGKGVHYLMGLHANGPNLFYALSVSPDAFSTQKVLFRHLNDSDTYMVAMGWVTKGNRILGVLYGAGKSPALNRNRIFARWLQKRVDFTPTDGEQIPPSWSLGPDRQMISIPANGSITGRFHVYSEDGVTLLFESKKMEVSSGQILQLNKNN